MQKSSGPTAVAISPLCGGIPDARKLGVNRHDMRSEQEINPQRRLPRRWWINLEPSFGGRASPTTIDSISDRAQ